MPRLAQAAEGNHVFWDAIFFLSYIASHGGAEVPEEIALMVEAIAAAGGRPVLFVESN